jgi:hypothetical protein
MDYGLLQRFDANPDAGEMGMQSALRSIIQLSFPMFTLVRRSRVGQRA